MRVIQLNEDGLSPGFYIVLSYVVLFWTELTQQINAESIVLRNSWNNVCVIQFFPPF